MGSARTPHQPERSPRLEESLVNHFTSIVRLFDAIAAAIAVFLGLASAPIEARVLVERDRD